MGLELQIGLFVASVASLIFVLRCVIKNKMNIHYSMIWIIWGIGMIIVSVFPQITFVISNMLSIQMPVNTVFLINIFLLYCFTFYVYLKLSKHNEEIINLNYEIANLKKQIEDLKDKND